MEEKDFENFDAFIDALVQNEKPDYIVAKANMYFNKMWRDKYSLTQEGKNSIVDFFGNEATLKYTLNNKLLLFWQCGKKGIDNICLTKSILKDVYGVDVKENEGLYLSFPNNKKVSYKDLRLDKSVKRPDWGREAQRKFDNSIKETRYYKSIIPIDGKFQEIEKNSPHGTIIKFVDLDQKDYLYEKRIYSIDSIKSAQNSISIGNIKEKRNVNNKFNENIKIIYKKVFTCNEKQIPSDSIQCVKDIIRLSNKNNVREFTNEDVNFLTNIFMSSVGFRTELPFDLNFTERRIEKVLNNGFNTIKALKECYENPEKTLKIPYFKAGVNEIRNNWNSIDNMTNGVMELRNKLKEERKNKTLLKEKEMELG